MKSLQNTLSVISFFTLLFFAFPQTILALHDIEADSVRIIKEAGTVQLIGAEQDVDISDYGKSLTDGDEIITGPDGKAHILLSMLSNNDEVFVAPSSRIRVNTKVSDSLTSVYHIHVLYGKIRVRTLLNKGKQIRFDTDLVEVTADDGEFIVESRKFGTSVGTISGLSKMVYKKTGQEYQIPQKTMMFVSPSKSVSPAKVFVNGLFSGVERSDLEMVIESYY
jgi:hypothetical protein